MWAPAPVAYVGHEAAPGERRPGLLAQRTERLAQSPCCGQTICKDVDKNAGSPTREDENQSHTTDLWLGATLLLRLLYHFCARRAIAAPNAFSSGKLA